MGLFLKFLYVLIDLSTYSFIEVFIDCHDILLFKNILATPSPLHFHVTFKSDFYNQKMLKIVTFLFIILINLGKIDIFMSLNL